MSLLFSFSNKSLITKLKKTVSHWVFRKYGTLSGRALLTENRNEANHQIYNTFSFQVSKLLDSVLSSQLSQIQSLSCPVAQWTSLTSFKQEENSEKGSVVKDLRGHLLSHLNIFWV